MPALPVYDIVLLPDQTVSQRSVALSRELARFGTRFTLELGAPYPHLSLYMANFTPGQLAQLQPLLEHIAEDTPALPLAAERFAQNEHGMFEVFYTKTKAIARLQEALIAAANPLRTGLREHDPVGRVIASYLPVAPEEARRNLEQYGYDEIGAFFKPHITFTRLSNPATPVGLGDLPQPGDFSTTYTTLALCEMGEHGTCTRLIDSYSLHI